jgi:hypothetical protein
VKRVLRLLFGVHHVIGRERALAIARDECVRRDWPWIEPVDLQEGPFEYTIRTNALNRGGNVNLRVRCTDGRVSGAAFAPY